MRIIEHGDCCMLKERDPKIFEEWLKIEPIPFYLPEKDALPPAGWVLYYDKRKRAEAQREFRKAVDKKDKNTAGTAETRNRRLPSPAMSINGVVSGHDEKRPVFGDKQLFLWLSEDAKRTASWIKANENRPEA